MKFSLRWGGGKGFLILFSVKSGSSKLRNQYKIGFHSGIRVKYLLETDTEEHQETGSINDNN